MISQFNERQKFGQWWLWLLLVGIGVFPAIGIYKQLILKEEFGSKPMSDGGLITFSLIIAAVIVLFGILRLETTIDHTGIRMRYFPFVRKNVSWQTIESVKVIDYGFVGGWGIRLWTSYGTVYNVSGSKGLAIQLKNGKKFLIGTQKPTELDAFLKKIKS